MSLSPRVREPPSASPQELKAQRCPETSKDHMIPHAHICTCCCRLQALAARDSTSPCCSGCSPVPDEPEQLSQRPKCREAPTSVHVLPVQEDGILRQASDAEGHLRASCVLWPKTLYQFEKT